MHSFDAVIVGAGAAGLFCAGVAGQLGLKVLVIDHAAKVAEKVRIAGGGRCNFTNRNLDPRAPHRHFLGDNPQFCRSALSRYTAQDFIDLVRRHQIPFHEKHKGQLFGDRSSEDFIALVQKHGIAFHEKHKGQLFCDHSAEDIIRLLLAECEAGGVTRWQPCGVQAVRHSDGGYELDTERGTVRTRALVVATGGLSIPKIGATGWGYDIAQQFGLRLVERRPGLVPLTFDGAAWGPYAQLAGLALPVGIETGEKKNRMHFDEDLLFTHRGLSGPAVLQISSYWQDGAPIRLNLAPELDLGARLQDAKLRSRKLLVNELAQLVPSRLAEAWVRQNSALQRPAPEVPDKALAQAHWKL